MAAANGKYSKDPSAVLDYGWTWTDWLKGDTLVNSTWTIVDDDDELVIESDSRTERSTTVWVSGGVVGKAYRLTNHVTTTSGREDDRTLTIKIVER